MDGILDRLFPQNQILGLLGDENMTQQARQQGLLGLAAGLLQAGGPSRTRTNIGQALGSGLLAGQQMYNQAVNQQITQAGAIQKLQEAQRQRQQQTAIRQIMPSLVQQDAPTVAGMQQLVTRDEEGNLLPGYAQGELQLNQAAANLLRGALGDDPDKFKKVMEAVEIQLKSSRPPEPKTLILGEGQTANIVTPTGQLKQIGAGAPKARELPPDVRAAALDLFGTDRDLTADQAQQASRLAQTRAIERATAGRPTTMIDMTGGQKGFENETKLRTEFQGSPDYKAFGEMKSAYGQVMQGLNKANAIGDLAAATKIMKLLDPGSVVRESELALAMQAGGLLDRVANYATNVMQGTKLSPAQRKEFAELANSLFSVSVDAFNEKRNQYSDLATQYGFDVKRVVGAEPSIPGLNKPQQERPLTLQEQAQRELERRRRGQ
jgi:hypothetical protein